MCIPFFGREVKRRPVFFGRKKFTVEVADSFIKRSIGLSGRDSIGANEGMLFVFVKSGRYGFWMHGMKFSIDILWLDSNMRVIYIRSNAKPCRSVFGCRTMKPDCDSKYVMELHAGTVKKLGIHKGDKFSI